MCGCPAGGPADGVDADQHDSGEATALHLAAQNGHTECARALLAAEGVDPNHTDTYGNSALIYAAFGGHLDILRALLAVDGIAVNHVRYGGYTALHDAAQRNHMECARALVAAKGIDHRLRANDNQWTALHAACANENAETTSLLLMAGSCRFALASETQWGGAITETPLALAGGDKAVLKVFASGVDYWQRRRHGGHSWVTKEAVITLLLVRQRLDARVAVLQAAPPRGRRLCVEALAGEHHSQHRLLHRP